MTVIAAALTADGVVMAADAQTSAGNVRQLRTLPKLWTTDQLALGSAGDVRAAQIARHHTTWPRYRPAEDAGDEFERWAVTAAVPALRTAVGDQGALRTVSGVEGWDLHLLLVAGDEIAEIFSDGAVTIDSRHRAAIGTGDEIALGHLGEQGPWHEADVIEAVRRATVAARGCGGPITVVNARTQSIRTLTDAEAAQ